MANLFWKFLERISAQGVSTVVSIILARLLMPSDYGVVTVVMIFINICNTFISEGFASALIQKENADQLDFSSMFYASVLLSTGIYCILFLAAPFISGFFGEGYELLTPVLRVLCLRIPIAAVNAIQQAYVSRHMMFKKFFWSTSIGTLISAFVGIGMAYCGMGAWALVAQYLTNAVIDTCVLWRTVKWRPAMRFSFKRTREMLSFSGKLLIAGLLDTVHDELRSIIIGYQYSPADLAYYNKGKHFPLLIVHNIDSSMMAVLYPVMSKLQNNRVRLREMAVKSIKLSTYVIFPCMLGFAAVAEPFVSLILTDKWAPCIPFIKIFCVVYSFYPIYTANLQAIKALGRSDAYMVTEIAKKIVGLLFLIITVPFGIYWIAMGVLLSKLVIYGINAISAKAVLDYKIHRQILDILPNVLLAACMYGILSLLPPLTASMAAELLIRCLEGCVIYILLSVLTRNESFFILFNMVKRKAAPLYKVRLSYVIKDMLRIRAAIRRCSDYLCPGKYKINATKTILYRKGMEAAVSRESTFLYKIQRFQANVTLLDKLISWSYCVSVKEGTKKFNGQLLLFTSSGKEVKIFDYIRKQVITVYEEPLKAKRVLANRIAWASYFPVVEFQAEADGTVLTEALIHKFSYNSENAFLSVFYSYIPYLEAQRTGNCFETGKGEFPSLDRFLQLLNRPEDYEALLTLLSTAPFCMTHGDLWTSNIVFDGVRFFHIDFENVGSRIFFFDLLMYLFSDYHLNKNDTLLGRYFYGAYDALMEELFSAAGVTYRTDSRLLYLEAILFLLFTERWDTPSSARITAELSALIRWGEDTQLAMLRTASENLFARFNEAGIRYCLLRDYTTIQLLNEAGDIDISVMEADQALACTVLEAEGWFTPAINPNTFSHTQYYKWDLNKMLKLDIVWGLYFDDGNYRLKDAAEVYAGCLFAANSVMHIPSPQKGLELLLFHLLLDKHAVSKKNMEQLRLLCGNGNGWATRTASSILALGKDSLDHLEPDASDLIREGVIEPLDSSSWRDERKNRIVEWENCTGDFGVAIIGVDGAGKSTLVEKLKLYYGSRAHVQYMGLRSYSTLPARLFAGEHRLKIHLGPLNVLLYMLSVYYEMKVRVSEAFRHKDRLILFDRYAWEVNDNAWNGLSFRLSDFLFKRHFQKPAGVVYLHCPTELSLQRKDDILSEEAFAKMKRRMDQIYMNRPGTLVINTSIRSPEEAKELVVEYICRLSQGKYR